MCADAWHICREEIFRIFQHIYGSEKNHSYGGITMFFPHVLTRRRWNCQNSPGNMKHPTSYQCMFPLSPNLTLLLHFYAQHAFIPVLMIGNFSFAKLQLERKRVPEKGFYFVAWWAQVVQSKMLGLASNFVKTDKEFSFSVSFLLSFPKGLPLPWACHWACLVATGAT